MFRLIAVLLVLIVCLVPTASLAGQGTGTIEGVAAGPKGGLTHATVQVIDTQGRLVSKVITDATGRFRITSLPPGTYIVQTVDVSGAVIGTAPVVVSAGSTATVTLNATAATIAGAASAAGGAAAGAGTGGAAAAGTTAVGGDLSTAAIIGGIVTAAAVAGTVAVVQTTTNASPSR
jgi:hypothetical protein